MDMSAVPERNALSVTMDQLASVLKDSWETLSQVVNVFQMCVHRKFLARNQAYV